MTLWTERDEPVLRWLIEHPPDGDFLRINTASDEPYAELAQLTQLQVYLAVETLRDAGYLASDEGQWSSGGGFTITRVQVTGRGKQALGLWPRFDALGSPGELASILDALAEAAPTDEEAGNLRRAASAVRRAAPGVIRTLTEAGLSAAARHVLGI
jgi:hypothetical protein